MKNRILSTEFENSSRAIIVKGLSEGKKSNDGKESKMALKSKFDKVVKTMKLSDQLKIDDIYRILPKEASGGDDYIPPIRVSFIGKLDREIFMANLSKLKDGEFRNCQSKIWTYLISTYISCSCHDSTHGSFTQRRCLPEYAGVLLRNFKYILIVSP